VLLLASRSSTGASLACTTLIVAVATAGALVPSVADTTIVRGVVSGESTVLLKVIAAIASLDSSPAWRCPKARSRCRKPLP
jgi:hypothetical protein